MSDIKKESQERRFEVILQVLTENESSTNRYFVEVVCKDIFIRQSMGLWGHKNKVNIRMELYFTKDVYDFFNSNKVIKSINIDLLNEDLSSKCILRYENLKVNDISLNLSYEHDELLTFHVNLTTN
jgi:hypothetical protein